MVESGMVIIDYLGKWETTTTETQQIQTLEGCSYAERSLKNYTLAILFCSVVAKLARAY